MRALVPSKPKGFAIASLHGMLLSLLLLPMAVPAQDSARGPDWRVYGTFESDGKPNVALYSVPDIVRSPEGVVRVWIQGLSITSADAEKAAKDKELLRIVAGRIKAGYAPPLNSIDKMDSNQVTVTALMEEIANQRRVSPSMVTLEEIDCKDQRIRYLSMQLYNKKGALQSSTNVPGEWAYSPPQSNFRNLATLVCDPKLTAPDNTPVPVELPQ